MTNANPFYPTPKHYRAMPRSVRIGCYHFAIEIGEMDDHEAERSFGHMNPISQKIRLRPGMTPQNLANTFLHEVLHGIHWFHSAGDTHVEGPMDLEEDYTNKGANGLCQFIMDNPGAMTWLSRTLNTETA